MTKKTAQLRRLLSSTGVDFLMEAHDGLSAKRIAKTINIQVAIGKRTKGKGGINPKKTPVTVAGMTDPSVWKDAKALVK